MSARYIKWDDVVARYPDAAKKDTGAAEMDDAQIRFAESWVEGRLARKFTVPFSVNNLTVVDLMIDAAYARALRFRNVKWRDALVKDLNDRIDALLSGEASMMTTSADQVTGDVATAWSNTEAYSPAFDKEDVLFQEIDPDEQEDEYYGRQ